MAKPDPTSEGESEMASRNLEAELDTLKGEFDRLRKEVGTFGETALEGIQKGSRRVRAAAGRAVDATSEGLSDAADEVERRGRKGLLAVEHQIEERPVISVLLAFGLGVLFGKFLDR
jgi:ElaB/YqjD/DUF883 family membrane-anchored ribosome-binding protein